MAGFFYFIPKARSAVVRSDRLYAMAIEPHGIMDAMRDRLKVPDECTIVEVSRGPDGGPGVVLMPVAPHGNIAQRLGYVPDAQMWREVVDGHGSWIGFDTCDPPTPPDLERSTMVAGYAIEDAAGNAWRVPIIRSTTNDRGALPTAWGFDPDTLEPRIGVNSVYVDLWQRSAAVWDEIDKGVDPQAEIFALNIPPERERVLFDWVIDCLAVNYRITSRELAILETAYPGYLSPDFITSVLNATVDFFAYKRLVAMQKKTPDP